MDDKGKQKPNIRTRQTVNPALSLFGQGSISESIFEKTNIDLITIENQNKYPSFMVNKLLSLYMDTILFSNEINIHNNVTGKMHFDYCINIVRSGKRYGKKWPKSVMPDYIEQVMEYYKVSQKIAKEYLQILTIDQVNIIIKKLDKGGNNKNE